MDGHTTIFIDSTGDVHKFHEEIPTPIVSYVILIVSFLLGFTLNFALLVSLVLKKELRSEVFNIIIIFIAATCLLDCIINEVTAFVFLLAWRSVASTWLCESSAACFLLVLMIQTSGVCLLCLERYLAVKEKPLDAKEAFTCTASCWTFGIVTANCYWIANSPTNYFPSRNVCGITQGNYGISIWTLVFGFAVPWATMAFLSGAGSLQLYKRLKAVHDSPNMSTLQARATTSRMPMVDENHYRTALKIILFYCILIIPHALIVTVSQITSTKYLPNHWENPKNATSVVRIVQSGVHDVIYTWARYQYNIIIPVVVFITYKHTRKHFKLLFFHRQRQNSVNNLETKSSPRVRNNFVTTSNAAVVGAESQKLTPVLFASSSGLHLRTVQSVTESQRRASIKSFLVNVCDLSVQDVKINTVTNACASRLSEEEEIRPNNEGGGRKNVRFASVVNEIPLLESGVFGSSGENAEGANRTHTVELPVYVRSAGDSNDSTFVKSQV